MQVIENLKVKEKVYTEKLENGLTVMIIPKKGFQKKYERVEENMYVLSNPISYPFPKQVCKISQALTFFIQQ